LKLTHIFGISWLLIGFFLFYRGFSRISFNLFSYLLLLLAFFTGYLKSRFILDKRALSVKKQLLLKQNIKKNIFISINIIIFMSVLGFFIKKMPLPNEIIGLILVAVGVGLMRSSRIFIQT
jgi:hypothetical protein